MRPLVRVVFSLVCAATVGCAFMLVAVLVTSRLTGSSVSSEDETQGLVGGLALFIGAGVGLLIGILWRRDWQAPAREQPRSFV